MFKKNIRVFALNVSTNENIN